MMTGVEVSRCTTSSSLEKLKHKKKKYFSAGVAPHVCGGGTAIAVSVYCTALTARERGEQRTRLSMVQCLVPR